MWNILLPSCKTFIQILYLATLAENKFTIKDTLDFANRLQDRRIEGDEVFVSYDVFPLFTEVPLEETIEYIVDLHGK